MKQRLKNALQAHLGQTSSIVVPACGCENAWQSGKQDFHLTDVIKVTVRRKQVTTLVFSKEPPKQPIAYPRVWGKAVWLRELTMPDERKFVSAMELEISCKAKTHHLMVRRDCPVFLAARPFYRVIK